MDLKEFYFQNIKESEYHHRFLNSVKKVNYTYNLFTGEEETQDYQFEIYDVEEAITKFKELCQPDVNFFTGKQMLVLSNNILSEYTWL